MNRCTYCGEPLEAIDTGNLHYECRFRAVMGSVAHLEHRCSCYVPGSNEGDPPGLTLRQAAAAALRVFTLQGRVN